VALLSTSRLLRRLNAAEPAEDFVNLLKCYNRLARSEPAHTFHPGNSHVASDVENRTKCLPAGLYDAWDLTLERQTAEAQTADAELAQECAGATTELAAVMLAAFELGLLGVLNCLCSG